MEFEIMDGQKNDMNGGWNEWSKYVLNEIVKLVHTMEEQQKVINEHSIEIAKLKTKFAAYATVAAFFGSILINLVLHFIK